MLANLMPPAVAPAPRTMDGGFLTVHPRYRAWLAKHGIISAAAALELRGEVVSGHHDRHVARVEIGARVVYLKREHRVGWQVRAKNARAGFGRVSRAVREAMVLQDLERRALPGPQWIAFGEDARGRAFLLVDELAGSSELRAYLAENFEGREDVAARVGTAVADLHAAGFATPDLSAKHLFVHPHSHTVTVIDWQSTTRGGPVTAASLGGLQASLAEVLATPRERLVAARAYWKARRIAGQRFGGFIRELRQASEVAERRTSIRDQRLPSVARQRLIWLAEDEAVCVVPELAATWPRPAVTWPYYPRPGEPVRSGVATPIAMPNGAGSLLRFRTRDRLGRLTAVLRTKSWRSPAVKLGGLLFHLERHGVDVPPLLAFGQRMTGVFSAESFLVCGIAPDAVTLSDRLKQPMPTADRRMLLFRFGAIVRAIHDAGFAVTRTSAFRLVDAASAMSLVVDPTRPGLRKQQLSSRVATAELIRLMARGLPPLGRTDALRVVRGYMAGVRSTAVKKLIRRVLRGVCRR